MTVYVYVPGMEIPGVNNPVVLLPVGSVHDPPGSGVPFKPAINEVAGLVAHRTKPPSTPGSGGVFTATVTDADSAGQGAMPLTVYV